MAKQIELQNFVLKEVFDIYGFDTSTGELKFMLEQNTDVTFTSSANITKIVGKNQATLAIYENEKAAKIEGNSGLISFALIGSQVGSKLQQIPSSMEVMRKESVKNDNGTYKTQFKGTGLAGKEIKFIYVPANKNDPGIRFSQGATASATEFSYAPLSREITLPTSVTDSPDEIIIYYFPEIESILRIENLSTNSSDTVDLVLNGMVRDTCDGRDYPTQIRMRAKTDPNLTLATGSEGAKHQFSFESVQTCTDSSLWTQDVYDNANFLTLP